MVTSIIRILFSYYLWANNNSYTIMAETARFELADAFIHRLFSRQPVSTTHPSFLIEVFRTSANFHSWWTSNPFALCRLCSDTEKHLGDFIYTRCSNPRVMVEMMRIELISIYQIYLKFLYYNHFWLFFIIRNYFLNHKLAVPSPSISG